MTPSDAHLLSKNLMLVQQNEREVQRFLSELIQNEDPNSVRFQQIIESIQRLLSNRDLLAQSTDNLTDSPANQLPDSPIGQRGREKQYYLLDDSDRASFIAQLQSYFEQYYNAQTRRFRLPDNSTVDAHTFLACVYDLGIRDGIAGEDAPVSDFADMAKEAAQAAGIENFRTAYNTIQRVTRRWRDLAGNRGYFDRTIHLYSLLPEDIPADLQSAYQQAFSTLNQVSLLKQK